DLSHCGQLVNVDLSGNELSALNGLASSAGTLKTLSCVTNKLADLPQGIEQLVHCDIQLGEAFADKGKGKAAVAILKGQHPGLRVYDPAKVPTIGSLPSTTAGIAKQGLVKEEEAAQSWVAIRQLLESNKALQERIEGFTGPVHEYFLVTLAA